VVDAKRKSELESEIANYADVIGMGMRSTAFLERLRSAEAALERLCAISKVVDVAAVLKRLPADIARYRAMVEDLGNSNIDVQRARETLREMLGIITVRPGEDGVPIAELALNEVPLALSGGSQIGLVAGAHFH
jgi:hypothetical protein